MALPALPMVLMQLLLAMLLLLLQLAPGTWAENQKETRTLGMELNQPHHPFAALSRKPVAAAPGIEAPKAPTVALPALPRMPLLPLLALLLLQWSANQNETRTLGM